MKSPIRNAIFALCCMVILCSAFGHKIAMMRKIVPSKMESHLEGRPYERRPHPTLDTLTDGSFQSTFEQYVADSIPARDNALLANAWVQRQQIRASNVLFRFPAYPTFYGCELSYVPKYDAIVKNAKAKKRMQRGFEEGHDLLEAFAQRHGDLRIFVMGVESGESIYNPTQPLVSNSWTTEDTRRVLFANMPDNVTEVGHEVSSCDELMSSYFRTDHHWHAAEGYRNYLAAIRVMLPETEPVIPVEEKVFDAPFYGSLARQGLMTTNTPDSIPDFRLDQPKLKVKANGKKKRYDAIDSWDRYGKGKKVIDRFENLYPDYFHGDWGLLELHNPEAQTDRSLLMLGNSYLNCFERCFAENYAHVYEIDFRHTDMTADEFLAKHPEVEDVFVVGQTSVLLTGVLE